MESLVVLIVCIALYLLPALMAFNKKKKNAGAILVTNLIFGWTFIGWCIALIWAMTND